MEKHILKQEDFKEIFSDFLEIVFFRNRKNSFIEISYLDYGSFKSINLYLYNSEIINVDGNISMIKLEKIQNLLTDLDIKELD